ncbi:MAG: hypothetical protein EOP11_24125 [Proteobacteria bacterium]|nr:MAG: hypothetical protein EOP11_24125 [Pseudomonadota bacterium]
MRQPLQKMSIAGLSAEDQKLLKAMEARVLSELNLKELVFLGDGASLVVENVKPNLKRLGAKLGKKMPAVTAELRKWGSKEIAAFEAAGFAVVGGERLGLEDLLIERKAAEGKAAGALEGMVAELDVAMTPALKREGLMRELVNRIQQRRKESKFNLSDRIRVTYAAGGLVKEILDAEAVAPSFLSEETLAVAWLAGDEAGLGEREEFGGFEGAWVKFHLSLNKN